MPDRPASTVRRSLAAIACVALAAASGRATDVERLRATGGLPAEVVGLFREPAAFERIPNGDYLVVDRAGHGVFRVTPATHEVTQIVHTGPEPGRVIAPRGFTQAGTRFLIADGPGGRERVQLFERDGTRVVGFTLPGLAAPRITFGDLTLSGVSSLRWTGGGILMSRPELGGLMTELSLRGHPRRTLGRHRSTGHEADPDLHLALNSGLAVVDPTGGYYFVFHAGLPMFRKYDGDGRLVFERHIEGAELDATIQSLPGAWPERDGAIGLELPVVPPTVRAAAVDPDGRLWISLVVPYTYVYDREGDKIRTVQFEAAGTIAPNSLFFERADRLLVTPGCYIFTVS